jgi:hypothetical protein
VDLHLARRESFGVDVVVERTPAAASTIEDDVLRYENKNSPRLVTDSVAFESLAKAERRIGRRAQGFLGRPCPPSDALRHRSPVILASYVPVDQSRPHVDAELLLQR